MSHEVSHSIDDEGGAPDSLEWVRLTVQSRFFLDTDVSALLVFEVVAFLKFLRKFKQSTGNDFLIPSTWTLLDEVWHQMILNTSDYQDFCQRNLNLFLHHAPELSSDGDSVRIDRGMLKVQFDALKRDVASERYILWCKILPLAAPAWMVSAIRAEGLIPLQVRRILGRLASNRIKAGLKAPPS